MAGTVWNPGAPVLDGIAICAPWLAAAVLTVSRGHARMVGLMASLVSVVASALLLLAAPHGDSLYEALMVLFSCLTAGMTLVLPKRDCDSRAIGGILFLLGATLLAYSSGNLVVFLTGWILSTIPFLSESWFRARSWRPATSLLLSSLALAAGNRNHLLQQSCSFSRHPEGPEPRRDGGLRLPGGRGDLSQGNLSGARLGR